MVPHVKQGDYVVARVYLNKRDRSYSGNGHRIRCVQNVELDVGRASLYQESSRIGGELGSTRK